jgi:hypothetical protein
MRRACACGQHTIGGGECAECHEKERRSLQRSAVNGGAADVPPVVHEVLRSPGQPLDTTTINFMESRFGRDFSRVQARSVVPQSSSEGLTIGPAGDHLEQEADRIAGHATPALAPKQAPAGAAGQSVSKSDFSRVRVHVDARAAESARAVNALAYTVGHNIVFDAGRYAPQTATGSSLLAHELTHVIQQGPGALQRQTLQRSVGGFLTNIFTNFPVIGFLFHFSRQDLEKYLKVLDETGKIEDDWDSDNKAVEIAESWKKGEGKFVLTARRKALLILEMLSGYVGGDDQGGILDLLERSDNPELEYIFGEGQVKHATLLSEFGARKEQLYRFYQRRFSSAYPDQTIDQMIGTGAPPTKPDLKKLNEAKPGGAVVQPGDKLPETTSSIYNSVKSKDTKRRTDPLTMKEADDLVSEVYGQYLPKDKQRQPDQKKGYAETNVPLRTETGAPEDPFESFLQHCVNRATPAQRRSPKEMDKWKDHCRYEESITLGYFDRENKEIVVRTDRESPSTRLHEVVHAYSDPAVDEKLTRYAREGLTEYLTRQIIARHKTTKGEKPLAFSQSYGGPYDAVLELSLIVGDAALARAHFQGDVKSVCLAVGKPVFDKWLEQMDSRDGWQEAVKILRQKKAPPTAKAKEKDDAETQCS